jgi:hypothetical protein
VDDVLQMPHDFTYPSAWLHLIRVTTIILIIITIINCYYYIVSGTMWTKCEIKGQVPSQRANAFHQQ